MTSGYDNGRCDESIPCQCSSYEWEVYTGEDWETDYTFTITSGSNVIFVSFANVQKLLFILV